MKNTLLSLLMMSTTLFAGCSMDDEEVVTTYTISCEVGSNSLVTFDIVAFECNSAGEKIEQKVIEAIGHNSPVKFYAHASASKVKIMIRMESAYSTQTKWVQQVYYLTNGGNTAITIYETTMIGPDEP
jgi:hypothetical protein